MFMVAIGFRREAAVTVMFENLLASFAAAALFAYLLYALLYPEKV
jgi:K+-transporting ATPase KdpF subunit